MREPGVSVHSPSTTSWTDSRLTVMELRTVGAWERSLRFTIEKILSLRVHHPLISREFRTQRLFK